MEFNPFRHAQIAILITLCGCSTSEPPPAPPKNAQPRTDVALTVAVVDDSAIATSINRFRGEWTEQSGGGLTVLPQTLDEFRAAESTDVDVRRDSLPMARCSGHSGMGFGLSVEVSRRAKRTTWRTSSPCSARESPVADSG